MTPPPRSLPHAAAPREARAADRAAWALVAGFGIALLWVALRLHPVGDYYTESDFYGGYASGARAIQHGVVDPARYPVVGPGYEFALALLGLGGADLFVVGKLLSVVCATLTLALWLVLARRRAGAVAGLAVAALFAVNPVFVRYGYSATTDMLGTCLASAAAFTLLEGRGRAAPIAAGVLTALATLTRYNLGALLAAGLLCLAWLEPARPEGRRRAVLGFLSGFVVVAAPWTWYAIARRHVPGINLYRNFGFYINPDASRNVQDEYGFLANATLRSETLLELLRTRPLEVLRRTLVNIPIHLWRDVRELLGIPAALLCALGAALAVGSQLRRALAPVWAIGASIFLALTPVFYSDRYSMPLIPIYLTFGAAFVAGREGWAAKLPAAARGAALLATFVALLAWCVPYQARVLEQSPIEVRAAGRELAAVARPGERVMSRKGHIGYYSGLEAVPFPRFKTLAELAWFARGHRAGYLYFSWYEALLRQEFAYLLDTTATVPGLQVLAVTQNNPSVLYRIGPEFGRDPAWLSDPDQLELHVARAMVQVLPDTGAVRYRNLLATDALLAGHPEAALEQARIATRARAADTLGWIIAGEALRTLGRMDQARAAFERAMTLDPKDPQARLGLGSVQLAQRDSAGAAATWRPLLSVTHDPGALAVMADLYARLHDEAAATAARRAFEAAR